MLSTITWNTTAAPTGGDWDTGSNWVGGVVPTASDDAVINLGSAGTVTISSGLDESVHSLRTNGNTTLKVISNSLSLGVGNSTLGPLIINLGATMSIAAGASVGIVGGVDITDNGTLDIADGAVVAFSSAYGDPTQIIVGGTGTLNATNAALTGATGNGSYITRLQINSGGHLLASGTTFAVDQTILANGVVLNSGDLTGNGFDTTLYVPALDVALLGDNLRFRDVYLNADTLTSGQSVALNLIGTQRTDTLRYVFGSNFSVSDGASLSIGAGVQVLLSGGVDITDNGTLDIADGAVVAFSSAYGDPTQIIVGGTGTLNATNAALTGATGNGSYITRLQINSGGHLLASGTTFAVDQTILANGVVLNSGDLTGNGFDTTLYVPALDVALLGDNLRFRDVYLNADTLTSGQSVALNLIGTQRTDTLRYVFGSNFSVSDGASLSIGAGVQVLLSGGVDITDNGTLDIADGAVVAFSSAYGDPTQIIVGGTGTLNATNAALTGATGNGSYITRLQINSGGHLLASGTTFAVDQTILANGVVLNSGDLTGNGFDTTLYVPALDVALLGDNLRFRDVYLNADTLTSGQSVALNLIGTQRTDTLRYVFGSNFSVSDGASLSIGAGVQVLLSGGVDITDNGTLDIADGAVVAFSSAYGDPTQIIVGGTGTLNATNAALTGSGDSSYVTAIYVNSGGQFFAIGSSFGIYRLTLNAGSIDTLRADRVSSYFTINSGATIDISGNDFSLLTSSATPSQRGLIAVGSSTATIDLTNNFWGTTNVTEIRNKIYDHFSDSTRPTVVFDPFAIVAPAAIVGVMFVDANGNGVRDGGEVAMPGRTVYIDANNNGTLDAGEINSTTQALDPNNPGAEGVYRFDGLQPGTYVVREVVPSGTTETAPAGNVTTTATFDDVAGGTTSVQAGYANISGGAVFVANTAGLLASGTQAYNATAGTAEVDFRVPVSTATFFYVHNGSFGSGVATAYAVDGTVVGTASSHAATTKGDPANFVTISGAKTIAKVVFSGGVVDDFGFTTSATDRAYYVRLAAGQTGAGYDFGNQSVPGTLQLSNLTPTSTGFIARFADPLDVSVLNLYGTQGGGFGPADATLVGAATGPVKGSMVISADHRSITFIKTGGILAPDTYTVVLRSGSNGFKATSGALLDGNGDGLAGDDLTATFAVDSAVSSRVVVSIVDFARGPGQAVDVPATGTGLPLRLSNGAGVLSVDLQIHYDPTLLTITGADVAAGMPADSIVTINLDTPGLAILTFSSPTTLPTGPVTFVNLSAQVPSGATYTSKEILDLSDLSLNEGQITAVDDDGIHAVGYFGDTTGNGGYSGLDSAYLQRVTVGLDSGFAAYQLVDPAILGDISGNGSLSGLDSAYLQQAIVGLPQPRIPVRPSGVSIVPGGPDPEIWVPRTLSAAPGETLSIPILFRQSEPDGRPISLQAFDLIIAFDPRVFSVGNVRLGSLAAGFGLLTSVDNTQGRIIITASSATPITIDAGLVDTLLLMDFTIKADAAAGSSAINLMDSVPSNLGNHRTFLNEGGLTLVPAPTNRDDDPIDGRVAIVRAHPPHRIALPDQAIDRLIESTFGSLPVAGQAEQPAGKVATLAADAVSLAIDTPSEPSRIAWSGFIEMTPKVLLKRSRSWGDLA